MPTRILVAGLAVVAALAAQAETLEPVVVTATRTEIALDETLASVVVIDRDAIERSLAADVAELLRFHAGLELGRNGGPGQAVSLFIRGSESNHALVLIDGVEINPGTIGGAALQNISPRMIERIEIVKGPRSSLYGSEAIGGVVNIITRQARGLTARAALGRYATRELSVSAGAETGRGGIAVSLSQLASDGFPTRVEPGSPERGYENFSAGLTAHIAAGASTLALRHWHSTGRTEYLDFFLAPLDQDYRNSSTALEWRLPAHESWDSTVSLSRIEDVIDQNQGPDHAHTRRDVLEWQHTLALGPAHDLVAGIYVAREATRSLSFGTGFDESTATEAVFIEDLLAFGRNRLALAARYTDHEAFGGHTTFNAEFGRQINAVLALTAAAGSGFRAPDATDRFGFGGNPDLEPERSRSYELGVRADYGAHRASLSAFRTDIDDLIEFVFDPETFAGGNVNVSQARIEGLEARHEWGVEHWQLTTTALVQDPQDRAAGNQLARRARRSLSLNLVRRFGPHSLGLDLLATSQRPDSAFSDSVNSGYVLASLAGRFELGRNWVLQGRVDNLLDTDYATAAGFRSAGRGLYLAAQYRTR